MDLSKVSYLAFMRHRRLVRRQLVHRREHVRLLDAAREDTPVIESLILVMGTFLAELEATRDEDAIAIADRDLQVFLALRSLEAEQRASGAVTGAPARTCGPRAGNAPNGSLN